MLAEHNFHRCYRALIQQLVRKLPSKRIPTGLQREGVAAAEGQHLGAAGFADDLLDEGGVEGTEGECAERLSDGLWYICVECGEFLGCSGCVRLQNFARRIAVDEILDLRSWRWRVICSALPVGFGERGCDSRNHALESMVGLDFWVGG